MLVNYGEDVKRYLESLRSLITAVERATPQEPFSASLIIKRWPDVLPPPQSSTRNYARASQDPTESITRIRDEEEIRMARLVLGSVSFSGDVTVLARTTEVVQSPSPLDRRRAGDRTPSGGSGYIVTPTMNSVTSAAKRSLWERTTSAAGISRPEGIAARKASLRDLREGEWSAEQKSGPRLSQPRHHPELRLLAWSSRFVYFTRKMRAAGGVLSRKDGADFIMRVVFSRFEKYRVSGIALLVLQE